MDVNAETQHDFRTRYLIQEKHNKKYSKNWENTYFPTEPPRFERIR